MCDELMKLVVASDQLNLQLVVTLSSTEISPAAAAPP